MSDAIDDIIEADEAIEEATKGKVSAADRLVRIATDETDLFRSPDDVPYAVLTRDGVEETWKLRSRRFRSWLARRHYEEFEKAPGSQAVADAMTVIEGRALFSDRVEEVHIRIAGHQGNVILDLGDETWNCVEITSDGWRVTSRPPVRFRRPAGMLSLPAPVSGRGSDLEDFRELLNIGDESDWLLTQGWVLGAFKPIGPYPIQELVGEAGSAKSTHARLTRACVDPATAPLRRPPRDGRDLMIAATNGWVIALDNLTDLSDWLTDDLCRVATGGGFATRQLFTDDDEVIFDAMRPIILTGIGGVGEDRNDLPDRTVRILKPRIPTGRRRKEEDLFAKFGRIHARVLGVFLDAVAVAVGTASGVTFDELPRMADFACWAEAAGAELGWEPGDFIAAYDERHARSHQLAIEASVIGPPLVMIARNGGFQGTASDLLARLEGEVDEQVTKRREWPKTSAVLGQALRRLAPDLRGLGLRVEQNDRR